MLLLGMVCGGLCLSAIACMALCWMLHAWRTPDALESTRYAGRVEDPRLAFSLIVPARHEEDVLEATLSRLLSVDHPNVEILVVVGHDDEATQAVARSFAGAHPDRLRLLIDYNWPKSKPKALNTAFLECGGDIVGVFDAEDEVHPALLRHVEACFRSTDAEVVQCGVQLMDYRSHWYSPRSVLEYFFWFRSRLHFQGRWRFVPLGGNTVFVRRDLLRSVGGWDPDCLTEDCDLGARLAIISARVTLAHDPELATREETPGSVKALLRQRTRWDQGFLQVLRKGDWRYLPNRSERLVAWCTLASPFLQAFTGLMVPLSVAAILWLKAPVVVALLTFVPASLTLVTLAVEVAGFSEFCSTYGFHARPIDLLRLALGAFPYQMLLAAAACRAVARELRGVRNWEKTPHRGSLRWLPAKLGGIGIATPPAVLVDAGLGRTWAFPVLRSVPVVGRMRAVAEHRVAERWKEPPHFATGASASLPFGETAAGSVITVRPWRQTLDVPLSLRAGRRLGDWARTHRKSIAIVLILLTFVGIAQAWGMSRAPQFHDDEGTYVAEAWAVLKWHTLSHYTYWYDHPPVGWLLLALWTWTTRAFDRYANSVAAGREAMLFLQLLSCALLYQLARRLRLSRGAAALAVILFTFSPLALGFHRMVLLDNIATPFILAAFVLALSPSRRLSAHAGSAACFAVAVLVKETSLLLLPALAWQLWTSLAPSTRRFSVALFGSTFLAIVGMYPLFALLRGELLPGTGHVSLLGTIEYQLFTRAPSGSVFDPSSHAHATVAWWLGLDPWLLGAGLVLVPAGSSIRRLRPATAALAIQAATLLRPGYLPWPYAIGMLPFASLVVVGLADRIWDWRPRPLAHATAAFEAGSARTIRARLTHWPSLAGPSTVLAFLLLGGLLVGPQWQRGDRQLLTAADTAPYTEAKAWLLTHVPAGSRLLVDDSYWLDLVRQGFHPVSVVWYFKLDLDPAVSQRFPRGWRDVDYVVSTGVMRSTVSDLPEAAQALSNSTLVASFGRGAERVEIRKVQSPSAPVERMTSFPGGAATSRASTERS